MRFEALLDCSFHGHFFGQGVKAVIRGGALSRVADPGVMAFFSLRTTSDSLAGQIAAQLLEQELRQKLEVLLDNEELTAKEVIQEATQAANIRLFEYTSKMLSGIRATAQAIVGCIRDYECSFLQTNGFQIYLWRDDQLIRIFRSEDNTMDEKSRMERLLGAKSTLLVDIATLVLEPGDQLICIPVGAIEEQQIHDVLVSGFSQKRTLDLFELSSSKEVQSFCIECV
jgi:hypothetical protein